MQQTFTNCSPLFCLFFHIKVTNVPSSLPPQGQNMSTLDIITNIMIAAICYTYPIRKKEKKMSGVLESRTTAIVDVNEEKKKGGDVANDMGYFHLR